MRKAALMVAALSVLVLAGTGCSTTAHFKLPPSSTLKVDKRDAQPDGQGEWTTKPFFWSEAGGAPFELYDANGKLVRSGRLKTKFRVVSIFWPPAAIIYWPIGLEEQYDLTASADGVMVTDEPAASSDAAPPDQKK